MPAVTRSRLLADVRALGLRPGAIAMAHLERALLQAEVLDRLDADDVHLRLLELARVVPVHRLPAGELVEHPDTRLARAVARLAVAAEGQVRLSARGRVVHRHHAGGDALAEAERPLRVIRVDRRRQPV